MRLWLKNIGAANDPLPVRWYDEGSDEGEFRWHVRFSEGSSGAGIAQNDLLLYHAFFVVSDDQAQRRLVGVARVSSSVSEHAPRSPDDQWPLLRRVTPLLIVPLAGQGVPLDTIGLDRPPQGGYQELTATQFAAAVRGRASNALPGKLANRRT